MQSILQQGRKALLPLMTGAALSLSASAASAQSLTFDLGAHIDGTPSSGWSLGFELHGPNRFDTGVFSGSFATAGRVNEYGDVWLGIGFAAQANFGSAWYVEGSLMPGLYYDNQNDLGHAIELRTLVGLGYRFAGGSSVMVAFDHLSNADLGDINPGTNMISLRYRRPL